MNEYSSLPRGLRNAILPSILLWALVVALVLLILSL